MDDDRTKRVSSHTGGASCLCRLLWERVGGGGGFVWHPVSAELLNRVPVHCDTSDTRAVQELVRPKTGIYHLPVSSQLKYHLSCSSRFHHLTTTLLSLIYSSLLWISDSPLTH